MAWVDTGRIDAVVGSTTLRQRLFAIDGSYSSTAFSQAEVDARAEIVSYLRFAGYADPGATLTSGSVAEGFLASRCAALMVHRAFSARGIQWPAGLKDQTEKLIQTLIELRDGKLPVPGLEPDTRDGYGGVKFSPPTGEGVGLSSDSRAPVFSTLRGTSF